jgi:hypothetical protein
VQLLGRPFRERIHHACGEHKSRSRVYRDGDTERLGNLFFRGALLSGGVDVCRDTAVTLASDADGDRDELSRLRVEMSGLVAGVTQLTIPTHRLGS